MASSPSKWLPLEGLPVQPHAPRAPGRWMHAFARSELRPVDLFASAFLLLGAWAARPYAASPGVSAALGMAAVAVLVIAARGLAVSPWITLPGAALCMFHPLAARLASANSRGPATATALSLVDRHGWMANRLLALPADVRSGNSGLYLGWTIIALACAAVWPGTTARGRAAAGWMTIVAAAALWTLAGPDSQHAATRRLFAASLVERHVPPTTLQLLGVELIVLASLALWVLLGAASALRRSGKQTVFTAMAAVALACAWWGVPRSGLGVFLNGWLERPAVRGCILLALLAAISCIAALGMERLAQIARTRMGGITVCVILLGAVVVDLRLDRAIGQVVTTRRGDLRGASTSSSAQTGGGVPVGVSAKACWQGPTRRPRSHSPLDSYRLDTARHTVSFKKTLRKNLDATPGHLIFYPLKALVGSFNTLA